MPSTGTEIDPALSAAAGKTVTVAGVPEAAAGGRQPLSAYAANANVPNVTNNGLYRTLNGAQRNLNLSANYAHELSSTVNGWTRHMFTASIIAGSTRPKSSAKSRGSGAPAIHARRDVAAGCSSSGGGKGATANGVPLVSAGQLKTCTHLPYPPFQFEQKGKVVGFDVDLVDLVAKDLGVKQKIVDTPFENFKTGAFLNSEECDLAAAGMLREQAYKIVQSEAMRAWHEEGDFRAVIENHPEIRKYLSPDQITNAFSVDRQLRSVDAIFARVFGE